MQYLGFYSQLNVPWPAGLMSLFKGFSFFNLSLEAIHLTCGGLAYTDIWMLQMVLPLFYPAAALVNIAADLLLAAAKPKWLMGLGWRPQRDFTLKALRDSYLPPALFFINMYFYTGISRSFEMLQCKPVDADDADAGEFLIANPLTKCWTGEHNTHAAIAGIGVFVYMVLPCTPCLYHHTRCYHAPLAYTTTHTFDSVALRPLTHLLRCCCRSPLPTCYW